ncbi:hypothetical protein RN001_001562 [Aquatica leii]|uniref:DDE Tnp4 domain-containing protein n=1 Tax=Aquatica leii TaxID=1421715 RepID=A0AAN7PNR1_9COLE|nr:hypothetical protein RN001_001562 [Aquatica leii]
MFEKLLNLIGPKVTKSDKWMRAAISARIKLEVTLRYLASGDNLTSLQYLYRVPRCTISVFLPEVFLAIYEALTDYIKVSKKKEEWEYIKRQFSIQWNFPHCCGAIDGKHVQVQSLPNSTSEFYNYKRTYSIVFFALVDVEYCFKYIEVGANGRSSDSTIFRHLQLNTAMMDGSLNLPERSIMISDNAFPLRTNLPKPYTGSLTRKQRIFNYRLSHARRVVENAFSILTSRFRIFHNVINLKLSTIDLVVKASYSLHNWLRTTCPGVYIPKDTVDREDIGLWNSEVESLPSITNLGINNYF